MLDERVVARAILGRPPARALSACSVADGPSRRVGRRWAGIPGAAGSLTCVTSMLLVAAGVGGSAADGMAAMSGAGTGAPGEALGGPVRIGPWLLAGFVVLATAALAFTRQPAAAVLGFLAGAVLYAGVYAQSSLAVIYTSIAAGYLAWLGLLLRVRAWPAGSATAHSFHTGQGPRRRSVGNFAR